MFRRFQDWLYNSRPMQVLGDLSIGVHVAPPHWELTFEATARYFYLAAGPLRIQWYPTYGASRWRYDPKWGWCLDWQGDPSIDEMIAEHRDALDDLAKND